MILTWNGYGVIKQKATQVHQKPSFGEKACLLFYILIVSVSDMDFKDLLSKSEEFMQDTNLISGGNNDVLM